MSYCIQDDVKDLYGNKNTDKWADLDNDGVAGHISDRIDRAIAWASNEVDSILRNSFYALPLANESDVVPPEVVNVVASLAGVFLYENRGVQDFDPETGQTFHRLTYQKKRAYETLKQIKNGQRFLNAVKTVDVVPKSGN